LSAREWCIFRDQEKAHLRGKEHPGKIYQRKYTHTHTHTHTHAHTASLGQQPGKHRDNLRFRVGPKPAHDLDPKCPSIRGRRLRITGCGRLLGRPQSDWLVISDSSYHDRYLLFWAGDRLRAKCARGKNSHSRMCSPVGLLKCSVVSF
jgi:hypothetical protein